MLITILAGIFLVLHGLVHLLYAGQSGHFFELRPGMTWPDGSWLFSRLIGIESTRAVATVLLVVAGLIFIAGGTGLIFKQDWWRTMTVIAASCSIGVFILLWDGRLQALDEKGAVGLLINATILFVVLILRWHP